MIRPEFSIVIPIGDRVDDIVDLHHSYVQGLDACGVTYEMIYVLDGSRPAHRDKLGSLKEAKHERDFAIIQLSRPFGEATALMAGFVNAEGRRIMTLPAYFQVEPSELPKIVEASGGSDMIVVRRWPRRGSPLSRLRRAGFHRLLKLITGKSFHDLGCSVRVFDRRVLEEVEVYGEQHRLLPVLAANQGFRVHEIELAQSPKDDFRGRYPLRVYLHRVLDMFTVFFLVRFTKKPLRFFGMLGGITCGIGLVAVAIMVLQRLFFDQPLADRPALLLASLFVVLGVQLFALGLLGELIIFTHARDLREYRISEIVEAEQRSEQPESRESVG